MSRKLYTYICMTYQMVGKYLQNVLEYKIPDNIIHYVIDWRDITTDLSLIPSLLDLFGFTSFFLPIYLVDGILIFTSSTTLIVTLLPYQPKPFHTSLSALSHHLPSSSLFSLTPHQQWSPATSSVSSTPHPNFSPTTPPTLSVPSLHLT